MRKHVLFITDYLPHPPISGDRIRVYHLARRLARTYRVSIAAPVRTPEEAGGVEPLEAFCEHVLTAGLPPRHPVAHLPGLARTALAGQPLELHFLTSAGLIRQIRALLHSDPVDILQFEHSRMAQYARAVCTPGGPRTVLTFHNVACRQFETIYRITRAPDARFRAWLFSRQMHAWEARCARAFDRCVAVSEHDRQLLLELAPGSRIDVAPNGVDTQAIRPLPRADGVPTVLMIGLMSYAPYTDSAVHFCNEVLPILRERVGAVQVFLVGPEPPPEVRSLEGEGVRVTGRVPEVAPYYQRAAVSVVPLRAGGGTRLKILEAMAFGRPVVSTSLGCEGLDVVDGEHLLVADAPASFAIQIERLLSDPALYDRIVRQARALVETQYDWDIIARRMADIYDELT